MGKLDHLKIKKAPAAFAKWAQNFNQQVDLLGSMEGGPGIDVQVAHSPRAQFLQPLAGSGTKPREQPRGRIKFTVRPSALNGIGISGGGGVTNSVNTNVIGSTGTISTISVLAASPSFTYPNVVRAGNGNTNYFMADTTGMTIQGTVNAVSIPFANVSKPMGIKTVTVCINGNSKSMDVIASDPY
jgi:hypothetical protein